MATKHDRSFTMFLYPKSHLLLAVVVNTSKLVQMKAVTRATYLVSMEKCLACLKTVNLFTSTLELMARALTDPELWHTILRYDNI